VAREDGQRQAQAAREVRREESERQQAPGQLLPGEREAVTSLADPQGVNPEVEGWLDRAEHPELPPPHLAAAAAGKPPAAAAAPPRAAEGQQAPAGTDARRRALEGSEHAGQSYGPRAVAEKYVAAAPAGPRSAL